MADVINKLNEDEVILDLEIKQEKTQRHREEHHVKMQAEIGTMLPQAKKYQRCWKPPKVIR